jgi:hypothetical protein
MNIQFAGLILTRPLVVSSKFSNTVDRQLTFHRQVLRTKKASPLKKPKHSAVPIFKYRWIMLVLSYYYVRLEVSNPNNANILQLFAKQLY